LGDAVGFAATDNEDVARRRPDLLLRRVHRWLTALVVPAFIVVGLGATTAPAASPSRPPVTMTRQGHGPAAGWDQAYGGLTAKRAAGGVQVTAVVSVGVTGIGLFCGNCDNAGDQATFGPIGGRLFAVVQRAATCALQPPVADGRRVVSVVSRAVGRQAGRDLTAGAWVITAVFPPGTLARGTWRVCSWFRFDPSYKVSNPAAPNGLAPGLPANGPWGTKGPWSSPALRVT